MASIVLDFATDEINALDVQLRDFAIAAGAPDASFAIVSRAGNAGGWPVVRFQGTQAEVDAIVAAYDDEA